MELIPKGEFYRNLALLNNRKLQNAVRDSLKQMEKANKISEISHLIKLKKFTVHYRVQIAKDYRIGLVIRGNKIWLVCFGHRNNFYKKFP